MLNWERCYVAREYKKKAKNTLKKAYDMGASDLDFLLDYYEFLERKDPTKSKQIYETIMEKYGDDGRHAKKILPMLKRKWDILKFTLNYGFFYDDSEENYIPLLQFFTKHASTLKKELQHFMPQTGSVLPNVSLSSHGQGVVDAFISTIRELFGQSLVDIVCYWSTDEYKRIMNDNNISKRMKGLYRTVRKLYLHITAESLPLVDIEMWPLMDDRTRSLAHIDYIETHYPNVAEEFKACFDAIKDEGERSRYEVIWDCI